MKKGIIAVGAAAALGILLLTRAKAAGNGDGAPIDITLSPMRVSAKQVGTFAPWDLYKLSFAVDITNNGPVPVRESLEWGSQHYLSQNYEEEGGRQVTIQPGQTYLWKHTFEEQVEGYYRGFFTYYLFARKSGKVVSGIWVFDETDPLIQ